MFFSSKPEPPLRPDQVNERGQVVDEAILKKDRVKFGVCTILDRSEEYSMGGVPTAIVKTLGGSDFHIGFYSSTLGAMNSAQFIGALILRWLRSNRRAMIFSMWIGVALAGLIALTLCLGYLEPMKTPVLWAYLILSVGLYAAGGFQLNLESTWIGDLVPVNKLGWFNSYKWILTTVGIILCTYLIGVMADWSPTLGCYAGVYAIFGASFIFAAFIYSRTTDRISKTVSFVGKGGDPAERLNYGNVPMWCYIVFYWCWSGGRTAMFAFTPAFLMDELNFKMTGVAWIAIIQNVSGIAMLYILGKITDRTGSLFTLLVMSAIVAVSMSLWIGASWWGITPIVICQVIGGAAGNTHSMVAINLALETLPEKGRAAYLGFSRLCIGGVVIVTPILAGIFMATLGDFRFTVGDVVLNRYHLLFFVCTLFTLLCVVPLIVLHRWTARQKRRLAGNPA